MTKKDYEMIARCIKSVLNTKACDRTTLAILCGRLEAEFAKDNPRFDPERFYVAAMVEDKP